MKLGPILGFRGLESGVWKVSILVVTDAASEPKVTTSIGSVSIPVLLKKLGSNRALRFDLEIPITSTEQRVRYKVDLEAFDFFVPSEGQPTRFAYASCNGFSSARLMTPYTTEAAKHERWVHLDRRHRGRDAVSRLEGEGGWKKGTFHLLLLGGDQVYADAIFDIPGPINDWQTTWWKFRKGTKETAPFTKAMADQAEEFYFNQTYVTRWSQPSVAKVLASIPTLMMWDDHDIFDGWGSHLDEMQGCPVFQGLFGVARENFQVFQLQTKAGDGHSGSIPNTRGFTWGFHLGKIAVLAPDMRSERTMHQVLSPQSWSAIYGWLDDLALLPVASRPTHLVLMSSIPLIYVSLAAAEAALAAIPGQQELEDDLRDHWCSRLHIGEQRRLVRRLLDFSKAAKCRVTIVSGDVHVAAMGKLTSTLPEHNAADYTARINQLISTAVVHPPPSGAEAFFIEHLLSGDPPEFESGILAEMLKIPGTSSRLRASRNWLSLTLDEDVTPRLWADWWFENEDSEPSTLVIHPS